MGNDHVRVMGICTLAITAACAPRPSAGYPDVACIVDDGANATFALSEEAPIQRVASPAIEFFLDEESGGPLRCRPSVDACAAFDTCVGAPIAVQVGFTATLVLGVRTIESTGVAVYFDELTLSGDPSFHVLQPTLSSLDPDDNEGTWFVAVTPSVQGIITANLHIRSDARNMPYDGETRAITLQVEGVQP